MGGGGGDNFTFFGFGGGGGGSGISAEAVLVTSSFGLGGGGGGSFSFDFVCALTIPPINKAISTVNVFFIKEIWGKMLCRIISINFFYSLSLILQHLYPIYVGNL